MLASAMSHGQKCDNDPGQLGLTSVTYPEEVEAGSKLEINLEGMPLVDLNGGKVEAKVYAMGFNVATYVLDRFYFLYPDNVSFI